MYLNYTAYLHWEKVERQQELDFPDWKSFCNA